MPIEYFNYGVLIPNSSQSILGGYPPYAPDFLDKSINMYYSELFFFSSKQLVNY